MLFKQVKEYSKRQRIDINKSDGLTPNADVVILTVQEYDEIKNRLLVLQDKLTASEKEVQLLQRQEQNLKEIIQDVTAPIYENHEKELEKKDDMINDLQVQLELLKNKINNYNLDLMGLNAIDMIIFRKHKKLIKDYTEEFTLVGLDQEVINADSKALPNKDKGV
ncbi:hypothetical protein IKD56_00670 [bacterium]|nr:hypothetical protein [bacterium]